METNSNLDSALGKRAFWYDYNREKDSGIGGVEVRRIYDAYLEQGGDPESLIQWLSGRLNQNLRKSRDGDFFDTEIIYSEEFLFYLSVRTGIPSRIRTYQIREGSEAYTTPGIGLSPSLVNSIIKKYLRKGVDFSDLYFWIEEIAGESMGHRSLRDVLLQEDLWISSDLFMVLFDLIRVLTNITEPAVILENAFKDLPSITNIVQVGVSHQTALDMVLRQSFSLFRIENFSFKRKKIMVSLGLQDETVKNSPIFTELCSSLISAQISYFMKLKDNPHMSVPVNGQDGRYSFTAGLIKSGKNTLWPLYLLNLPFVFLSYILFLEQMPWYAMALLGFLIPMNLSVSLLYSNISKSEKIKKLEESLYQTLNDRFSQSNHMNRLSMDLIVEREQLQQKVQDRTRELTETNEKLKQMDIEKTSLYVDIAHELKTPLTLVLSPLEMLFNGHYGKVLNHDSAVVQKIYSNAKKLKDMVDNLLDYEKLDHGWRSLHLQDVSISQLINVSVGNFELYAKSLGVRFELHFTKEDDLRGYVDYDLLSTLITNLLSNAIKYSPEEGIIRISLDSDDNSKSFTFSVEDQGCGIPDELRERIFERFFKVHNDRREHKEGTGLGLPLVKEIVEMHNGTIDIGQSVLGGARFTVTLPRLIRRDNIPATQKSQHDLESLEKPQTLLIVEDNAEMAAFIGEIFEKQFNLFSAVNGIEAITILEEGLVPDIIISDISMPHMDGYSFFRHLSEDRKFKHIPFVFLSAKTAESEQLSGLELGVSDYLCKPFSADILRAKVNRILQNSLEMKKEVISEMQGRILSVLDGEAEGSNTVFVSYCESYSISDREREIIVLIRDGLQNKEIADRLGISPRTVANHIRNIFHKSGVNNRTELINKAF
jgi:signal transduction histidine kinase/DNA-binding NarL/FixJ family response regulator